MTRSIVEIRSEEDLLPPGAEPGTVPTDLEQSTGLERFEILGKMQGVDVFDMRPLDASRKGMWVFYFLLGELWREDKGGDGMQRESKQRGPRT